jgi:hypothetical protein
MLRSTVFDRIAGSTIIISNIIMLILISEIKIPKLFAMPVLILGIVSIIFYFGYTRLEDKSFSKETFYKVYYWAASASVLVSIFVVLAKQYNW